MPDMQRKCVCVCMGLCDVEGNWRPGTGLLLSSGDLCLPIFWCQGIYSGFICSSIGRAMSSVWKMKN